MKIPAPITVPLRQTQVAEHATLLPKGPGVYAFRRRTQIVHLGWSPRLNTRIARLLSRTTGGSSTLGSRMADAGLVLDCWCTGSKLESSFLMYQVLRSDSRADYRKRLRLNLPWFVAFTAPDPFPRLAVTNRIPERPTPIFGPFKSRDHAQRYADDVLGCFALRRCADPLIPDPNHPGCIYGEIKQCLRPCQTAVSEAEYGTEAQRVYKLLLTNGDSELRALSKSRDEAVRALQFEQAADLHKRIGRLKEIGKERDDLVCDARALSGIALTKGVGERVFRLWPMVNGLWREPWDVTVEDNDTPESLVTRLNGSLNSFTTEVEETEADSAEHLAILVRWYHSSWRDGYWYPLRADGRVNSQRLSKSLVQMMKERSSA